MAKKDVAKPKSGKVAPKKGLPEPAAPQRVSGGAQPPASAKTKKVAPPAPAPAAKPAPGKTAKVEPAKAAKVEPPKSGKLPKVEPPKSGRIEKVAAKPGKPESKGEPKHEPKSELERLKADLKELDGERRRLT